ncbi:MAG: glutathione S-transferase family protein [Oligoflexia bacterium]|nr:glutathione S-transferase family protein [Oligoflexia bacterium]
MLDFSKSKLFISARSPFARRVRVCFDEHGINYEEVVLDVFKANPEFEKINPLARVPAVQLKSGSVIIDSNSILDAFYRSHQKSELLAHSEREIVLNAQWSGIAVGLYEQAIQYYLETLRPVEKRDLEIMSECEGNVRRTMAEFERFIKGRAFITGSHLSQSDIDMVVAIDYLRLRCPEDWLAATQETGRYGAAIGIRPSFVRTKPPPPQ